ncbi:hypothetical protein MMC26_002267 [Xylographa opegraphella]|nr:hypothetical protein [Xylographa opegraphella]
MLHTNLIATVAVPLLLQALSRFHVVASPGCGTSCLRPSTDVLETSGDDPSTAQPGSTHPPDGSTSAPAAQDPPASATHPTSPDQPVGGPVGGPGVPNAPVNQGSLVSPTGSRIFAGLFGDAQGISRNIYHARVDTSWHQNQHGDSPYHILCGTRNAQVQMALGAATMVASSILNTYLDIHAHGASAAPFTRLDAILPFGNGIGDVAALLDILSTFQSGSIINVPLATSGSIMSPRVAVCATSTMLQDYGVASEYYDVCQKDPLIAAYHPANSAALILCPSFFELAVHNEGSQCPIWNRFFQTFYYAYERRTVEYRSYTILRGFISVKLGTEETIYVSPSPRLPNWNELLLLPQAEKERSSALYQLYVAMFEQKCDPSPVPDQDSFNQYTWHLFRYYLGVQNAQGEPVIDVVQMAAEQLLEPSDEAGPSNLEGGETSHGTAE